jgi:hypothetical protein
MKHLAFVLIALTFLFNNTSIAQYQLDWATPIDAIGISTETLVYYENNKIVIGTDNCIYSAGVSIIGGQSDLIITKTSTLGVILWQQIFDNGLSADEDVKAVAIDNENNFIVVGNTKKTTTDYDILLLKYDSNGNLLGQQTWSSIINDGYDYGTDVSINSNGSIYISGYSWNGGLSYSTIKYSQFLNKTWEYTYNGNTGNYSYPNNIVIENQGSGVYMTCQDRNIANGNDDCGLIKLDSNGVFQWKRTYNGTRNGNDYSYDLEIDKFGNPVYVGNEHQLAWTNNFLSVKYKPNGDLVFANEYSHPSMLEQTARAVSIDSVGNVYVTGETYDNNGSKILTIKINQYGNLMWSRMLPSASSLDYGWDNTIASNGDLLITGTKDEQGIVFLRYDSLGVLKVDTTYAGASAIGNSIISNSNGDIFIFGVQNNLIEMTSDFVLLKYSPVILGLDANEQMAIKLFPNPSTGIINLDFNNDLQDKTIEVYNVLGSLIFSLKTKNNKEIILLENQAEGLYLMKISVGNEIYSQRIIINK